MNLFTVRDVGKRLYPHLPAIVQEALLSGYFYAKSHHLYGPEFHRQLALLEQSQWYGGEKLRDLQCASLRRVIDAAAHVPHYRKLFRQLGIDSARIRTPEDLSQLPLLDKDAVREAPECFVDERLDRRDLFVVHTSGTSGKPLRIYQKRSCEAIEEAFLARQWRWAGFNTKDRRVKIRGDLVVSGAERSPRPWRRNFAQHELRMSAFHLSKETVRAYVERIRDFQPRALIAYPSSAATLAALVRDQKLDLSVPLVFASSETLSTSQRTTIEQNLGARVYGHYGLTEAVVAIQECDHGSYHVIPEYGITEFLPISGDHPGSLREIVSTGFVNDAMPLLRYRTGDYARMASDNRCSCGRAFPVVHEILGREDDFVRAASGAWVGRLHHVFNGLGEIVEAQIIQEPDGCILVRLVPGKGYSNGTKTQLERNLRERLGDLSTAVECVAAIPRGRTGKFRAVICRVETGRRAGPTEAKRPVEFDPAR